MQQQRTSATLMCRNSSQHPIPVDWMCVFVQKCPFRFCFCAGDGRVGVCPTCLMWTHECPLCSHTLKESGRTSLEFDHISRHMKNKHPGYNKHVVRPLAAPRPSLQGSSSWRCLGEAHSRQIDSQIPPLKRAKFEPASPGSDVYEESENV